MAVAEFLRDRIEEGEESFPQFPHLGRMLDEWFGEEITPIGLRDLGNLARDIVVSHFQEIDRKFSKRERDKQQKSVLADARKIIFEVGEFLCSDSPKPPGAYADKRRSIEAVLNLTHGYMSKFPGSINSIVLGSTLLAEEIYTRRQALAQNPQS